MNRPPFWAVEFPLFVNPSKSPYIFPPYSTLDSETLSFLTASGITSQRSITAINNLVIRLKTQNLYNKFDRLFPYAGTTLTQAAFDLITKTAGTFFNSPTYSETVGVTFNGTTQVFSTAYNPAAGVKLTLNDASYTVHSLGAINTGGTIDAWYGCTEAIPAGFGTQYFNGTTGVAAQIVFVANAVTAPVNLIAMTTDSRCMTVRTGAHDTQFYHQGLSASSSGATPSTNRPNAIMVVGGLNIGGTVGNLMAYTCNLFAMGSSLSSTDAANFNTIMGLYKTDMGR